MRGPLVIERIALGEARTADGRHYGVIACRHDRDWPGTASPITFAVEEYRHRNGCYGVVRAWGFHCEENAWHFLTSDGYIRVTTYDLMGRETIDIRLGLGISDGSICRAALVIPTSQALQ